MQSNTAEATREPLGTKQINLLGEKLLQISALSLKGEELQLRLPPRESARPGEIQVEIGRTRLQPVRQIYVRPVISLAAVPQQQRDREIIGADTLLGACPAGAQCIAADAGSDGKRR